MSNQIIETANIITSLFKEQDKQRWDDFIEQKAINSTFLHSRRFFEHEPLNADDDSSLLFSNEDRLLAVLPAVKRYDSSDGVILHSHLRSTYGGFVVSDKVGVREAVEIVNQTVLFAKSINANQIIIRNPFRIFHTRLCDETDYAMWYHGFRIKSRELEIAMPIHGDLSNIRARYHNDTKRNIRKALANLEVVEMTDLREFWQILEKCQMERHGKKPVHHFESICRLIANVGREKILAFGVHYHGRLIGGCVVFIANERVLHGQYIAAEQEYLYLKPVHALIDHVITYGNENGFRFLNLGMANEDEGRVINYGLFSIKEHFGGRGLLRETMILDI